MAATAIIASFEAVEPIVYRWRRDHTTDGALGIPAHVTLASPFLDDTDLQPEQLGELGAVLGHFQPFDVSFAAVGALTDRRLFSTSSLPVRISSAP
jgi:hypothetical protein